MKNTILQHIKKNQNTYKTLQILIFVILFYPLNTLSQERSRSYVEAYKICSPAAHQIAKQQCRYGRNYEIFYTNCMQQRGYGEDLIHSSPDYYKKYVEAYRHCSSVANQRTKEHCDYGGLFNRSYSKCMNKYGFDRNGRQLEQEEKGFRFDF